jgi:hypothetical protein
MADKLGNWVFLAASGGWEWRRLDPRGGEDLQRSTGAFVTLLACISDARRHGYLAPGHNETLSPRVPRDDRAK